MLRKVLLLVALVLVATGAYFRWERSQSVNAHHEAHKAANEFESIFVMLQGQTIDVPKAGRKATGGGLTSMGDAILVLTGNGRIYSAGLDGKIAKTNISAPENGYDAYLAASKKPPYDAYKHNFEWYRYFDIATFDHGGNAGLLVSYLKYDKDRACYSTAIARAMIDDAAADPATLSIAKSDWIEVFATQPCLPLKKEFRAIEGHMAGGRIVVDDTGQRFYLASGDYHWDGQYGPLNPDPQSEVPLAQATDNHYGKVLAVDIMTGNAQVLSRGHRNVQGIAIDADGEVWTVEHGPRGGDELNRIRKGSNFGWPLESFGTKYSGLPAPSVSPLGRHDKFEQPAIAWLPSIATAGMTTIRNFHEAWKGDLLVSTLGQGHLSRVRVANGDVVFAEMIRIGKRIRYVHEHTDGTLALWLDDHSQLLLLRPAQGNLGAKFVEKFVREDLKATKETKAALHIVLEDCAQCHSFTPDSHNNAPSLANIFGQKVGSTAFTGYTDALDAGDDTWTRERLDRFLENSEAVYPGVGMPNPAVEDKDVRKAMVDLLEALQTN